jgi:hypothetical protein
MIDEERQKLVAWLRDCNEWTISGYMGRMAADEIERLATENGRLTQVLIDKLAWPKQPDASVGLIEAAEIVSGIKEKTHRHPLYEMACDDIIAAIRARAADRSEK